jgi:hypothetical protein
MFSRGSVRGRRLCGVALATALLLVGSLPACVGDDRCSDGQIYSEDKCWPIDTETDTGTATDTDTGDGGSPDGGDDLPSCMDYACSGPGTGCEGCEADYCAWDPINEVGSCTVQNCAVAPDSCPAGYACCDFMDGLPYPNFCMPDADWQEQHDNGICID